MSLPLLVFDLDGTLADSSGCVTRCMAAALDATGLPPVPDARIRRLIGLPLRQIVVAAAPEDATDATKQALFDAYCRRYADIAIAHEQAFDGIHALLDSLADAGHPMAIATGKSQIGADRTTAQLGLRKYFAHILGGDSVPRGKPHPDLLLEVMERTGASPNHTWMIGDTIWDLRMARAAGEVRTCAVTWGCHDEVTLTAEVPDRIARQVSELVEPWTSSPRRGAPS